MKIYVNCLGNQVTQESLECLFETYGRVQQTSIFMKKPVQNHPDQRWAQVVMADDAAAIYAVQRLNGSFVNGLQLQVTL